VPPSAPPRTPAFRRRYGNLAWDGVLRASGLAALVSIPLVFTLPQAAPLVGFALVTIWVNGPLAPFLPATYEPILILYGRLYPPVFIGLLGIVCTIYVEYLNYHLYRHILHIDALSGMRDSKTIRRISSLFLRAPFFTVWLCSWSPLPYWTVRFMSPLAGYPVSRHLVATFLGRFPRLWFFAALGAFWNVDIKILIWISVGSIILAIVVWLLKGQRPRELVGEKPTPSPVASEN
jgi:hypothetical protein